MEETDQAGNTGTVGFWDFTIDTTTTVTIDSLTDNEGVYQGNIQSDLNNLTNDKTPGMSGTAEAGATITIKVGDIVVGTAVAGSDGKWSTEVNLGTIADGSVKLDVIATDAAGNTATASETITLDTTPPSDMTFEALDDVGGGLYNENIPDGGLTNDKSPTWSGTGEPGARIEFLYTDGPAGTVGRTGYMCTVGDDGTWTYQNGNYPDGTYTLEFRQVDAAGNASDWGNSFTFTVDATPPDVVKITEVVSDAGKVAYDGFTSDDTLTVKGTAEPNSVVNIWVGLHDANSPTGWSDLSPGHILAQVDSNGNWSIDLPKLPADGSYRINAVAGDAAGNYSHDTHTGYTEFGYNFTVDTTPPGALTVTGLTDNVGLYTGDVAKESVTDDNRPTLKGEGAEPGATIVIEVWSQTEGKHIVLGTGKANADGTWSVESTVTLADGRYNFRAHQIDEAGNEGPRLGFIDQWQNITVDTKAPEKPTVTLNDDFGTSGTVANGGTTDDVTPKWTGKGEPGAEIQVMTPAGIIVEKVATVDSAGNWTYQHGTFEDGTFTYKIRQVDKAGNTSDWTESKFTIDSLTSGTSGNNAVFYAPQSGTLTLEITYNRWAEVTKVVGKVSTWNGYDAPAGATHGEWGYQITNVKAPQAGGAYGATDVEGTRYVLWYNASGTVVGYTPAGSVSTLQVTGISSSSVGKWVVDWSAGALGSATSGYPALYNPANNLGSRDITQ
ncbi:TPA: hypothetical protein JAN03_24745, partial [Citrobacter freundii]|nr:hypothetical protein [Citrobacter freundii]